MLSRLFRRTDDDDNIDDVQIVEPPVELIHPEAAPLPEPMTQAEKDWHLMQAKKALPASTQPKQPTLIEDITVVTKPKEDIRVVSVALLDSEYTQLIQSLNNEFFEETSPGRRRILAILDKIEKAGGTA